MVRHVLPAPLGSRNCHQRNTRRAQFQPYARSYFKFRNSLEVFVCPLVMTVTAVESRTLTMRSCYGSRAFFDSEKLPHYWPRASSPIPRLPRPRLGDSEPICHPNASALITTDDQTRVSHLVEGSDIVSGKL